MDLITKTIRSGESRGHKAPPEQNLHTKLSDDPCIAGFAGLKAASQIRPVALSQEVALLHRLLSVKRLGVYGFRGLGV